MPDATTSPPTAAAPRALSGAYLITRDTNLRINSFGSVSGAELTIVARSIGFDGQPVVDIFTHTPNSDRSIKTTTEILSEGWLVSMQAYASTGAVRRGRMFVRVELIQGFTGATLSLATVLQGYVSDTSARAWPGSPIELSIDGRGALRSIAGTNPAAGVEISETVPTNARWRLQSIYAQFATSATVANRRPTLTIDDGAAFLYRVNSGVDQAASATWTYVGGAFGAKWASFDGVQGWTLPPDLILGGGYRIRTVTTALDAGDDYGAPQMLVEEWIED